MIAASVIPVVVIGILWMTTGRGEPICWSNLKKPSQEDLIKAGISQFLREKPALRLRYRGADEFLQSNSLGCCSVEALGARYGTMSHIYTIAAKPQSVGVFVQDSKLRNRDGYRIVGSLYEVSACDVERF